MHNPAIVDKAKEIVSDYLASIGLMDISEMTEDWELPSGIASREEATGAVMLVLHNYDWMPAFEAEEMVREAYNERRDAARDEGYEEGYSEGHEIGWEGGYDKGYQVGADEGYDEGYYTGLNSSGESSL